MGCDIHGVFQRKLPDGTWEDVKTEYECERDYTLFAILAGVRNSGYITPISEPRGLPDDFLTSSYQPGPESDEDPADYGPDLSYHPIPDVSFLSNWRQKYFNPKEDMLAIWMGDHSHSWLTSSEILDYYEMNFSAKQDGWVDRATYEQWDKKDSPDYYCGGIWGADIVKIEDTEEAKKENPDWNYIFCVWDAKLTHQDYFFDEVRRLENLYGEIRFVFGFDS